jgi:hypothetical protein
MPQNEGRSYLCSCGRAYFSIERIPRCPNDGKIAPAVAERAGDQERLAEELFRLNYSEKQGVLASEEIERRLLLREDLVAERRVIETRPGQFETYVRCRGPHDQSYPSWGRVEAGEWERHVNAYHKQKRPRSDHSVSSHAG